MLSHYDSSILSASIHTLLLLVVLHILFAPTITAEVPVCRERKLCICSANYQCTAMKTETTVITERAVAIAQIRCLFIVALARIRAELPLGIVGRILVSECLLDWCHGKLHVNVIKAPLHHSALIQRFALLNRTQRESKKLLLNGVHLDTTFYRILFFNFHAL